MRRAEGEDDFALFHRKGGGDLLDGRLRAVLARIFLDECVDVARRLFERARNFHAAVVAQKAFDLARDHGHGIRRKAHAEALVKARDRLQKPHAGKLEEIVVFHPLVEIAP